MCERDGGGHPVFMESLSEPGASEIKTVDTLPVWCVLLCSEGVEIEAGVFGIDGSQGCARLGWSVQRDEKRLPCGQYLEPIHPISHRNRSRLGQIGLRMEVPGRPEGARGWHVSRIPVQECLIRSIGESAEPGARTEARVQQATGLIRMACEHHSVEECFRGMLLQQADPVGVPPDPDDRATDFDACLKSSMEGLNVAG